MAKFILLEGQHVAADRRKPLKGADGKPTGRFETRTYKKGETVEADADLVAKFGEGKFRREGQGGGEERIAELESELAALRASKGSRVPGDPTPYVAETSPAVAPGGQVSTGFQKTGGGFETPVPSGAMTAEDIAEAGLAGGAPQARAKSEAEDLDALTVDELKQRAADEEVHGYSHMNKAELVKALGKRGRKK